MVDAIGVVVRLAQMRCLDSAFHVRMGLRQHALGRFAGVMPCGCCNPVAGGAAGRGGGSGALAAGPSSLPAGTAVPDNCTIKDTATTKRQRFLVARAVLKPAPQAAVALADIS